jgi:hypothetical protein
VQAALDSDQMMTIDSKAVVTMDLAMVAGMVGTFVMHNII